MVDREKAYVDVHVDTSSAIALRTGLFTVCAALYFPGFYELGSSLISSSDVPEEFRVITVQGGMTNQLYRCSMGDLHDVLVRVYGAKTEEVINRRQESVIVDQISRIRAGPRVYGRFANGRLEEWLATTTALTPDQMLVPHISSAISARLRHFHSLSMPIPREPQLWSTLESWSARAAACRFDDQPDKQRVVQRLNLHTIKDELAWLRAAIARSPAASQSPIVFSHNDLLSGNILWDEKAGRVTFVDYEYGSYSYRGFDIANHFCECCGFGCEWDKFPSREQQEAFMRSYLGTVLVATSPTSSGGGRDDNSGASTPIAAHATVDDAAVHQLFDEVQPFILASHLFWGLWAVVQARYSPIDFDYMGYAALRFAGYAKMKPELFPSEVVPTA